MHVHDCLHKLNYLKHIETNIHFIYTYLFFPECRAITWSDNILSISYKREKNIIVTFILPGICRQIILHLDKLIFFCVFCMHHHFLQFPYFVNFKWYKIDYSKCIFKTKLFEPSCIIIITQSFLKSLTSSGLSRRMKTRSNLDRRALPILLISNISLNDGVKQQNNFKIKKH